MNRFSANRGFTLIELMIAVAIVGILAAIALPSYQSSLIKSRRADAKTALLDLANAMERHFTVKNTYCDAGSNDGGCGDGNGDTGAPTIWQPQPQTTDFYTITIDTASATQFTLQAEPINAQADDPCGNLTLDSTGTKDISGTGDYCW